MGQLGCGVEQRQLHFLAHVQIVPRVACGQGTPGSPTVPSVTPVPCRSPSQGHQRGCHKVGVSWGVLGEASGAPAQQHHPGWSLSSQHSQCHAEGNEVRGDPTSKGDPSSPQDSLFAAPTAIPGDLCVRGRRKQGWGAGGEMLLCASLPIPVNNSRTEEWN